MGILSRFTDIIGSNINALLDKCEDPSKMIDHYLMKAIDDLAEVKKETASVMAEEARCKRIYTEAKDRVEQFQEMAKKALLTGNEDDACKLLAKKQTEEATLKETEENYRVAHQNAEKMRQMHDKLTNDINNLKARRNNVKATVAVAKTQTKLNKAQNSIDNASSSIGAFARMEEKAQRMRDEAEAMAELNAGTAEDTEWEQKYGNGSSASVAMELEKMKMQLGLTPEPSAEIPDDELEQLRKEISADS